MNLSSLEMSEQNKIPIPIEQKNGLANYGNFNLNSNFNQHLMPKYAKNNLSSSDSKDSEILKKMSNSLNLMVNNNQDWFNSISQHLDSYNLENEANKDIEFDGLITDEIFYDAYTYKLNLPEFQYPMDIEFKKETTPRVITRSNITRENTKELFEMSPRNQLRKSNLKLMNMLL